MIFKLTASLVMLLPGGFLWLDRFFHEEEGTSLVCPEAYSFLFLTLMVAHAYCTERTAAIRRKRRHVSAVK